MKIKEISVGLSGTIPSGSYENLKPSYNVVIELEERDNPKEVFNRARADLREMFELESNRAKTDLIDKQYDNIRFYEQDGKKYPSVTSILSWDANWRVTEDELNQYASRGTIVHKLIEIYLHTKKWEDPMKIEELKEDVAIVLSGSKKLHWDDCTYKKFFEVHGKDIEISNIEVEIINTEIGYGGRVDAVGTYKGKPAIFDWKTGATSDFRQLSAYACALECQIETLIIAPVGQSDNKSGVMKPKICDSIDVEFKNFKKARQVFLRRFGI